MAALFLSGLIAIVDFLYFRIPNVFVGAFLLLGVWQLSLDSTYFFPTLACAFSGLGVGYLLFLPGWIGAGDAKLLGSVLLYVGYNNSLNLILAMGVLGGVLSLLYLLLSDYIEFVAIRGRNLLRGTFLDLGEPLATPQKAVPYGIAIAGACMWVTGG